MEYRSWSDEKLTNAFEGYYKVADPFHQTPRWKRVSAWIACTIFPIAGLTAVFSMLERAPLFIIVMVVLGLIGFACLLYVLQTEAKYRRDREKILDELVRRGIYERLRPIPWEH